MRMKNVKLSISKPMLVRTGVTISIVWGVYLLIKNWKHIVKNYRHLKNQFILKFIYNINENELKLFWDELLNKDINVDMGNILVKEEDQGESFIRYEKKIKIKEMSNDIVIQLISKELGMRIEREVNRFEKVDANELIENRELEVKGKKRNSQSNMILNMISGILI